MGWSRQLGKALVHRGSITLHVVARRFHWTARGCARHTFVGSLPDTAVENVRRIDYHALAREMFEQRISLATLALESRYGRNLDDGDFGDFGGQFIFGGARFEILELAR